MQQTSDFKQPSQTATFDGDAEQNVFVNQSASKNVYDLNNLSQVDNPINPDYE